MSKSISFERKASASSGEIHSRSRRFAKFSWLLCATIPCFASADCTSDNPCEPGGVTVTAPANNGVLMVVPVSGGPRGGSGGGGPSITPLYSDSKHKCSDSKATRQNAVVDGFLLTSLTGTFTILLADNGKDKYHITRIPETLTKPATMQIELVSTTCK